MATPLAFPTRVSRVYPVLTLVLLLTSCLFLYQWQSARVALGTFPQVQQRNDDLTKQVTTLTNESEGYQTALKAQTQQITADAAQVASLQNQLTAKENQVTSLTSQVTTQQTQLTTNASELQKLSTQPPLFSFENQTTDPNITQEESDVKTLVTNAYQYIENIYGAPYQLDKVTIDFVGSLSMTGASGDIVITTSGSVTTMTIQLQQFDKTNFQDINTVIHEMVHSFHGAAVFQTSALEEGITVATTDAVMKNMETDGLIPTFQNLYLTTSPSQYSQWNSELTIPADNSAFYASPLPASASANDKIQYVQEEYQLEGTAWYQLYTADPNAFKKINAYYYPKVRAGDEPTSDMIRNAIEASVPSVNGQPIASFIAANSAFNPS